MDKKEIVKCIVNLYWDYDRLSSSGQVLQLKKKSRERLCH